MSLHLQGHGSGARACIFEASQTDSAAAHVAGEAQGTCGQREPVSGAVFRERFIRGNSAGQIGPPRVVCWPLTPRGPQVKPASEADLRQSDPGTLCCPSFSPSRWGRGTGRAQGVTRGRQPCAHVQSWHAAASTGPTPSAAARTQLRTDAGPQICGRVGSSHAGATGLKGVCARVQVCECALCLFLMSARASGRKPETPRTARRGCPRTGSGQQAARSQPLHSKTSRTPPH